VTWQEVASDCGHLKSWSCRLGAFLALNIVVTFLTYRACQIVDLLHCS